MKAVEIAAYGRSEVLRVVERATPVPGPGQYLLQVLASSINPIDWKLRRGSLRFMLPRFPLVLGFDVCGRVASAGPGATHFKPDELVYTRLDSKCGGAYAQFAVAGEAAIARKPEALSVLEAAAVPLAGLTALQALRDLGKLQERQHVLVVGGSGGVGHFAVQIAKALGAHVTASCGTANVEMVRALGADRVIDYKQERYSAGDAPFDVIFDTAIADPFATFAPLLARSGRYVAATPSPELILRTPLLLMTSRRRISFVICKPRGRDLETLGGWAQQGKLRPHIDRVYALAELPAAHAYAELGHVRGKVVIDVESVAGAS